MILPIILYASEEVDCKLYLITTINSVSERPWNSTFWLRLLLCLSPCSRKALWESERFPCLHSFLLYVWPGQGLFSSSFLCSCPQEVPSSLVKLFFLAWAQIGTVDYQKSLTFFSAIHLSCFFSVRGLSVLGTPSGDTELSFPIRGRLCVSEQKVPTEDGTPVDVCELITQTWGTPFYIRIFH